MERIRALITRLQEQSQQNADATEMLGTVKMLQLELTAACNATPQKSNSKISVVLPPSQNINAASAPAEPVRSLPKEPEPIETIQHLHKVKETNEAVLLNKNHHQQNWFTEPVEEIPTFAHQKEFKELNDVIGHYGISLNDRLKTDHTELVSVLKEGPVKDLKKAIGINDRFVFLNELFRGDEAMYERSIKTINNFRIYPEAEYWIERELKVKLGWDENKPAVKQFSQLVRRRFL